jgi:Ca2+-binding EF-hand superfamily protein
MHEGVGTLYSMSPQVLQGVYTSQADLWSAGVMIYMLLSSHRPFYSKKRKVMIDKIMRCDYSFGKSYWEPVSDEAKDMIDKLLVMDPKKRMDATEALKHIWLSKEFKLSDRKPDQTTADAVQDNLMHYKDVHALKKIALNVIAHKSSTDDILQLRKCFDQYDTANNGIISYEEFMAAIHEKNYPEEQVKEIFNSLDVNKNGVIMYTEFIAATLEAQGHIEEERVAEAFDRLDSDDSGFISKKNLTEFLGSQASSQDIQDLINEIDGDGDGEISYVEFLSLFQKNRTHFLGDMSAESTRTVGEGTLVGLDAKIPGGKFDSGV